MRILIPVDDMPYTLASLCSVKQRIWPEGTKVVLCRVIEDCSGYGGNDVRAVNSERDSLDSDTYYNLQKSEKWIRNLAENLKFENCDLDTAILIGDVAEQLANLANQYSFDYIVIGSHEREPSVRNFLVSIASSITDKVNCSVEIVRPRLLHQMLKQHDFNEQDIAKIKFAPKRIVLATDFSDNSLAALNWLSNLGCAPETEIAVIAVEPPVSKGLVEMKLKGELDGSRTTQLRVEDIGLKLRRQTEKLKEGVKGRVVENKVLKGDPADKIVEYSKKWQADLIVVGAHGVTGSYDLMMGSTTRSVMDASDCSVVSVHSKHWSDISFEWKSNGN